MDLTQTIRLENIPRKLKYKNLTPFGIQIETETKNGLLQLAGEMDADMSTLAREILRAGVEAIRKMRPQRA